MGIFICCRNEFLKFWSLHYFPETCINLSQFRRIAEFYYALQCLHGIIDFPQYHQRSCGRVEHVHIFRAGRLPPGDIFQCELAISKVCLVVPQ